MNYAFCQYRGVSVNCGPRGLPGEADHLFHNNGAGPSLNANGRPDPVAGNDSETNYLYMNKAMGRSKTPVTRPGLRSTMTAARLRRLALPAGDYENNGQVDFVVTDFGDDYNALYHNDGNDSFSDVGDATDAGSLEIRWPSGERGTIKLLEVDRIYTVTEGNGITSPCAEQGSVRKTRERRSSIGSGQPETHSYPTRCLNEPYHCLRGESISQ